MSITEKLLSTPKLWERENDIIQWGVDRNIIGDNAQATFESQQEKTRQEWEEWKRDHTADDLGDQFVTLVMGAALKGLTVSECVQAHYSVTEFGYFNESSLLKSQEELLDYTVEDYLEAGSEADDLDIAFVVNALAYNATKRGWTLEECIEVAWNDIKDRKGKMLYGMFIKQKDLDALSELGVEVVEDSGEVFFEGLIFLDSHMQRLNEIFYLLSITFEQEGDYSQGVHVKSTGRT